MFIYLPLILLFSTFHHIEGSCKTFDDYYVLGELVQTPAVDAECDLKDHCTFVSMDIPALAVGSISGCSGDIHMRFVVGILSKRKDLHDSVEAFMEKNNMSLAFPRFNRLSNYGDQLHTIRTVSGDGKVYLHFSKQGYDIDGPAVIYKPPPNAAKPAKCTTDSGTKECTEGFCGIVELSSVSKDGKSQVTKKIQDCPNEILNELYLIAKNASHTDFNHALVEDIKNMGSVCASKASHTMLSKNGLSSFYWHINCFVPDDHYVAHIPLFYFHTPHNYYSFYINKDDK